MLRERHTRHLVAILLALLVAAGITLLALVHGYPPARRVLLRAVPFLRPDDPQRLKRAMSHDGYVGQTEAQLRAAFGWPADDQEGYHPLGLRGPAAPLAGGPIRTTVYETKTGSLWVWLERRGGNWICFESEWVPNGTDF